MEIKQKAWKVSTTEVPSEIVYAPTQGKAKGLFMSEYRVPYTQIEVKRSPKDDILLNEFGQPELRFMFEKRKVEEFKVINSPEDIVL